MQPISLQYAALTFPIPIDRNRSAKASRRRPASPPWPYSMPSPVASLRPFPGSSNQRCSLEEKEVDLFLVPSAQDAASPSPRPRIPLRTASEQSTDVAMSRFFCYSLIFCSSRSIIFNCCHSIICCHIDLILESWILKLITNTIWCYKKIRPAGVQVIFIWYFVLYNSRLVLDNETILNNSLCWSSFLNA